MLRLASLVMTQQSHTTQCHDYTTHARLLCFCPPLRGSLVYVCLSGNDTIMPHNTVSRQHNTHTPFLLTSRDDTCMSVLGPQPLPACSTHTHTHTHTYTRTHTHTHTHTHAHTRTHARTHTHTHARTHTHTRTHAHTHTHTRTHAHTHTHTYSHTHTHTHTHGAACLQIAGCCECPWAATPSCM